MEAREWKGGGIIGLIFGAVLAAGRALGAAFEAATRDGHLAAAGRQGFDEIGMALKAFPESIQAYEPGTVFSPTQGEIASAREADGPSPADIARDDGLGRVDPEQTYSHSLYQDRGR